MRLFAKLRASALRIYNTCHYKCLNPMANQHESIHWVCNGMLRVHEGFSMEVHMAPCRSPNRIPCCLLMPRSKYMNMTIADMRFGLECILCEILPNHLR